MRRDAHPTSGVLVGNVLRTIESLLQLCAHFNTALMVIAERSAAHMLELVGGHRCYPCSVAVHSGRALMHIALTSQCYDFWNTQRASSTSASLTCARTHARARPPSPS